VKRVIRKKKNDFFCELNLNKSIVYKWLKESELTLQQKNLFENPKNFIIKCNNFRSDFKKSLFYYLPKHQSNTICFKVSIDEEVYRKLFSAVSLNINSYNNKCFDINKQNFMKIFKFDLCAIELIDRTNQYFRLMYPLLISKPRFSIRKNYNYLCDSQDIYYMKENLKFFVSFKCGNL
jgi:hypothetical protein